MFAHGWNDSATRSQLIEFMTRCVDAGADIDRLSGSFLLTPLHRAVALKKLPAILALVRLGAKPEVDGQSLIAYLESCSSEIRDHIPVIQSALMEIAMGKTIAASLAANPPPAPTNANTPAEPRPSRRRMGAI
jgi:hypothetical protein